jgi:hypothetical protein
VSIGAANAAGTDKTLVSWVCLTDTTLLEKLPTSNSTAVDTGAWPRRRGA